MTLTTDLATLDVRTLACSDRHARIFATFDSLAPGESLLLVNDHDPRPLRAHFDVRHPGEYDWAYVECGPAVWSVRISRHAAPARAEGAGECGCCSGGRCS